MTVTVRLMPDEERRLDALSARTGRTRSFYVRTALREYLEDLEDAYAADDAMRDLKASGGHARPLTDLVAELGLAPEELARA